VKVEEDKEQGINYNKYETGKNLKEEKHVKMEEESTEKIGDFYPK
jgi:hypothetical protein